MMSRPLTIKRLSRITRRLERKAKQAGRRTAITHDELVYGTGEPGDETGVLVQYTRRDCRVYIAWHGEIVPPTVTMVGAVFAELESPSP